MNIAEALYKSATWSLSLNGQVLLTGGRITAKCTCNPGYAEILIFYGFEPEISNGTAVTFTDTKGDDLLSWEEAEGTSANSKFKVTVNPDGTLTLNDSHITYTLIPEQAEATEEKQ